LVLLLLALFSVPAQSQIAPGYYVLAYVLNILAGEKPAPQYELALRHVGPFDYPTASAKLDEIGVKGMRDEGEYYPVHTVQKAWIYYCTPGCQLE